MIEMAPAITGPVITFVAQRWTIPTLLAFIASAFSSEHIAATFRAMTAVVTV